MRLGHLQTDFQIFSLLERSDPSWTTSVLRVAAEIIALIVELGNRRRNAKVLLHDFSWIVRIAHRNRSLVLFSDMRTDTQLWLTRSRSVGNSSTQYSPQRRYQRSFTLRIGSCDVNTEFDRLCLATREYSRAKGGQLRHLCASLKSDFSDP